MNNINIGLINLIISEKIKKNIFNNINESLINNSLESTFEDNILINEYFDVIKSSPILMTEFKVINNIENKHIENDTTASRYIDNNIKLFEIYTLDEVINEKNKLNKFFIKEYINKEYDDKIKLYESINNLIIQSLNDYDDVDVNVLHESFDYVLNHIKTPKNSTDNNLINPENIDEGIIKIAVDKFNERYGSLSHEEKEFLNEIFNGNNEDKKNLFEKYKKENIQILERIEDSNLSEKKKKVLEKISNMNYNKSTIDDDLISLYELKSGLI